MRSNYTITIEDEKQVTNIYLHCTLRQANKAFISLGYALAGNEVGYKSLTLCVISTSGEATKINAAKFNGLQK